MLSEEIQEKLVDRLVDRMDELNNDLLKLIGKSIKEMSFVYPDEAYKLGQILKYGGDLKKIEKKLAKITKLNIKDIQKIMEEIAKKNYKFAKQYYDYNNIEYVSFEKNISLKRIVDSISRITADNYYNISKTSVVGYRIKDKDGNFIFKNLTDSYRDMIDKAVLGINQGKTTYWDEMRKYMKQIKESGIRCVEYESGRTRRMDTSIRMNMLDSIRNLTNEIQIEIGKQFNSDGVEISVHEYPAPDHEFVQGKQFTNEEFNKFQNDEDSRSYDGTFFSKEINGNDRRSIGQYNCYHYVFSIVLGVNKPQYSKEQLEKINERNNKGVEIDGKHYSIYEVSQIQRKLETEIRKEEDYKIMALESGDNKIIEESDERIFLLMKEYRKISKLAKLQIKKNRLNVQ